MLLFAVVVTLLGQSAGPLKPVSDAERTARFKRLLSPIHLSDPIAPIVREGLEKRVTLSFDNTPLPTVVEQLAPMLGGNISLGEWNEEDGKPAVPMTITYRCKQKLLADALEEMLAPHSVGFRFVNEGVEICDRELLSKVVEWRIYPIHDLIGAVENDDIQMLMAIQESIDRDSWEPNGGSGQVNVYPRGCFVIANNAAVHRRVAEYFAVRRLSLPLGSPTRELGVLAFGEAPPHVDGQVAYLESREFFLRDLQPKLSARRDFNIHDASIEDAVGRLGLTIGIPIEADLQGIEREPLLANAKVTIVRSGIEGRTALNLLCSYGLRLKVSEERIVVESDHQESKVRVRHSWRAYPTGDIIAGLPRDWSGKKIGPEIDPVLHLTNLLSSYGDDRIACHDEAPHLLVIDYPLFSAHLVFDPRREHRRFEELYAGIREALRRQGEFDKLAGSPVTW